MEPAEVKECWVLLRGLGREAAHWGDFPALLSTAGDSVHVTTVDLPGSGVHWRESAPCSVAQTAFRVRAMVQEVLPTPRPKCHVVAMSLGAMVAIEWLSRWPEDVDGAVLINASVGGLSKPWQRLRPRNLFPLSRIMSESEPLRREALIHQLTCQRPAPEAVIEWRAAVYRQRPFRRSNLLRQLLAAARYRLPENLPNIPLLLLVSAEDRFVNPGCSLALRNRVAADLAIHPWANHDLPFDDPEWVIEEIWRWRRAKERQPQSGSRA